MDIYTAIAIITLAGLLHASFQLSVSMITLLSSHSIGSSHAARRTLRLAAGFYGGVAVMTALIVSIIAYLCSLYFHQAIPTALWVVACGLMIGIGVVIWGVYYRHRSPGTTLWIPRGMALFLSGRTKATKSAAESFSLGLTSVISELVFIIAPTAVAAFALMYLPLYLQLPALCLYVLVSTAGVGSVVVLVGSGHKLSRIQRWRESNKRFLQFIAGSGFLVLGAYIYANLVAAISLSGGGLMQ